MRSFHKRKDIRSLWQPRFIGLHHHLLAEEMGEHPTLPWCLPWDLAAQQSIPLTGCTQLLGSFCGGKVLGLVTSLCAVSVGGRVAPTLVPCHDHPPRPCTHSLSGTPLHFHLLILSLQVSWMLVSVSVPLSEIIKTSMLEWTLPTSSGHLISTCLLRVGY